MSRGSQQLKADNETYGTGEDVSEQEPMSLSELWVLRVETLDQAHERASTGVRGENRLCELATERILGIVLDCPCEEAAVEVEDTCISFE